MKIRPVTLNPDLPEPTPPKGQVLIYHDGAARLQVRLEGDLSQRLTAELLQVSVKTANEHLGNIYSEGEPGFDAERLFILNPDRFQDGGDGPCHSSEMRRRFR